MNDLVLIHAPTVYDFREREINYGPVSDLVPSTPVFEMYPIGFLSIMSNLCPDGYRIKIENIALEMLMNKKIDVEKRLSSLESEIFGIDLHWLPHVHGVINIAKILKKIRPDIPVVLGGLSATYFHDEIMKELPFIDYVMLGDTTEPFFRDFIDAVEEKRDLSNVPNLIYRENGKIKLNRVISPEKYIDQVRLDYKLLIKNCIKNLEIIPYIPYSTWMKSSTAMTFIQKGCHHNCVLCGGSKYAYKNFYYRNHVSYRPVKNVVEDIKSIEESMGVPIYVSGDIYQAGPKYREEFFRLIRENGIDSPILFELFNPAQEEFYKEMENSIDMYAMEISPESSNEYVRSCNGRYYTNFALEKNMEYAKKYNAGKMDIFFSIGLSQQKKENISEDVQFARKYHDIYNDWVHFFTSPISPFIDPGSLAFELSENFGYRIFARTLMDHYNLLDRAESWVDALNYETLWLSKNDIGNLSIEAGNSMALLRSQYENTDNKKDRLLPAIFEKSELMWSEKINIKTPMSFLFNTYREIYFRLKIKN
ncbi:MAG: TIGR04190 family B12-binding domain/radical SAM domain protein [Thermoplasmata archaeon]